MPERSYQIFLDDQAVENDLYPRLIEVEVEDNADEADAFRIRLGIQLQQDGEWSDTDDARFALFTKVRVEVGFKEGSTEVLAEGYITDVQLHFEDPARQPFLELHGLDSSVLMGMEEKIVTWPNLSDSDIATQILTGYGFTPDVTSTSPVHQENDVTVIQRASDLDFLRRLARKNGFVVGVERDFATGMVTGYFRQPALGGSAQKALAVAFGDATTLTSFDVTVDGVKPLAVETGQIDVKAKTAASGTGTTLQLQAIGEQDLEALVGSAVGGLISPKETAGKLWLTSVPTSDATELTALAQAVRDEAGWLVTARGEINSDAYGAVLRANRLVLVKGAGALYSGKYFVTRVVHRLGSDGRYQQTFEARRNAVGLDGSEDFGDGPSLPR